MTTQTWFFATVVATVCIIWSCSAALLPSLEDTNINNFVGVSNITCPNYSFKCPECHEGETCVYPAYGDCPEAGIPVCEPQGCEDFLCSDKPLPCPKECPYSCRYEEGSSCCPFQGQPKCELCDKLVPCQTTPCPKDCPGGDCVYPDANICCPTSGQPICRTERRRVQDANHPDITFSSSNVSKGFNIFSSVASSLPLSSPISSSIANFDVKNEKREYLPYSPDGANNVYPQPPNPYQQNQGDDYPVGSGQVYEGSYPPYDAYPDSEYSFAPKYHGKDHWPPASHPYHHGDKPVYHTSDDTCECPKTLTKTIIQISYVFPTESVHTPISSTKTKSVTLPTTLTTTITTTHIAPPKTQYSHAHGHGHGNWKGHHHEHGGHGGSHGGKGGGDKCPPCAPLPTSIPGIQCYPVNFDDPCCPLMECTVLPVPPTNVTLTLTKPSTTKMTKTTSKPQPSETDGVTCADYIIVCPKDCPDDCVYPSNVPCPYQHTPSCRPKTESEDCKSQDVTQTSILLTMMTTTRKIKPTESPVVCPQVMYSCPAECPDNCIRPDVPCPYAVPPHCPVQNPAELTPVPATVTDNEPPYMTHVLCPDYMIQCPLCPSGQVCVRSKKGPCPNTNAPYCVPIGSSLPPYVSPVSPSNHRSMRENQILDIDQSRSPHSDETAQPEEALQSEEMGQIEKDAEIMMIPQTEDLDQLEKPNRDELATTSPKDVCSKIGLVFISGVVPGNSLICDKECEDIKCHEGCANCCMYTLEDDCCSRAVCVK